MQGQYEEDRKEQTRLPGLGAGFKKVEMPDSMTARVGGSRRTTQKSPMRCLDAAVHTNQQGHRGIRRGGPGALGGKRASWVNRHLGRRMEIGRSVD